MMDYERVIKKYPNRRLYDTAISSYITLEEVKTLSLEESVPLKIIETRTGRNITQNVLMQVIADQGDKQSSVFSQEFLRQIIRISGDEKQSKLRDYLDNGMQTFLSENKNSNCSPQQESAKNNNLEANQPLANNPQSNFMRMNDDKPEGATNF